MVTCAIGARADSANWRLMPSSMLVEVARARRGTRADGVMELEDGRSGRRCRRWSGIHGDEELVVEHRQSILAIRYDLAGIVAPVPLEVDLDTDGRMAARDAAHAIALLVEDRELQVHRLQQPIT